MFPAEMLKRLLQHNRPKAAENDVAANVGYWGAKRTRCIHYEFCRSRPIADMLLTVIRETGFFGMSAIGKGLQW